MVFPLLCTRHFLFYYFHIVGTTFYTEALETEEKDFLNRRKNQASSEFYRLMQQVLVGAVGIACLSAMIYAIKFGSRSMILQGYLFTQAFTLLVSIIIGFFAWGYAIRPLQRDIKKNVKVIEQCPILSKKYMPENNSWHFYIQSSWKYSIEVTEADFQRFELSDEVNIEYAPHSQEYFGYF